MLEELIKPYVEKITGAQAPRFEVKKLQGDASSREYYRIQLSDVESGATSIILMKFDPHTSGKSEEAARELPPGEFPFISVLKYLELGGLRVPVLYYEDVGAGMVFLEDLGDVQVGNLVKDSDNDTRRKWYCKAIDLLVKFQRYNSQSKQKDFIGFNRGFAYDLLMWECDHYVEWGIEALYGKKLREPEIWPIQEYFERICNGLTSMPQILVHRDFQSRNMMVLPEEEIALIDFQDALMGPWPYDLVALLRDSYVKLDDDLLDELIEYYCTTYEKEFETVIDRNSFKQAFYLQTLQRKLKDSGRFVFIDRVKKNDSYLKFIPNSLSYVKWAFDRLPEYEGLREVLARHEERLK